MLQNLRIRNLALVEELAVEFLPGLNVLTGETGAGKSVIVGALGLLLGERADKTLIRAGADQANVEALFHLASPEPVNAVLRELGLDPLDHGQLLLRRSLSATSAPRLSVNDSPVTLQALKRLGDLLVDMHGPHDHQSLLNPDYQLGLLDAFGRLHPLREPCATLHRNLIDLRNQRRELEGDEQAFAREMDFLAFQVKELEAAEIRPDEEETLLREHTAAANAQELIESASALLEALTDGESAALPALQAVLQRLERLAAHVPEAAAWRDEAHAAAVRIRDLAAAIAGYAQKTDADPDRLQQLEARMALFHKLKRKYGAGPAEWLRQLESARTRLHDLQNRDRRIAAIEKESQALLARLREAAKDLHAKRVDAARKLARAVTAQLRDLGFAKAGFDIQLADAEPGPAGMDTVEFGFAPNPGEPARPLRAIASSGEISRVMLALKTVLAEHDRIPLLVFDEIDANIGGETAAAVGLKLAELSGSRQIIAITHMPQVAVHGRAHFAVAKEVRDNRTRTSIEKLDAARRTEEVARMLGGKGLTSVVLQHAREMLARAATPA